MSAPKKSYGQNFLIDEEICHRIVDSFIQANDTKNVLEVGPGRGALTKILAKHPSINFKAVELDQSMTSYLNNYIDIEENLILKDFLKLDLTKIFDGESFSVIGNFPYNISSQILFKIEQFKELVPLVVGMFQKEVADRIVSQEGSKKYGIISVLLQAVFETKHLFDVGSHFFYPAPKVTSSVIMLQRKNNYTIPCDPGLFKSVVKLSFNQRRKMIRNSLKSLLVDVNLGDNPYMTRRPEQMSLEDYITLTKLIQNQK